jgi:hypothetical protein
MQEHGYTKDQFHDWYLSEGRPAAPQQMTTAWARGIDGPDGTPMDETQFLKGIRESDVRPEWGPMLWGVRFAYPPLFQLSRLVQAGAITPDIAADWAKKERYAPEVVTALHSYWSGGTTAGGDTHVAKAQVQLWTTTHKSYLNDESDEAEATSALTAAGVAATAIPDILTIWQHERSIVRRTLTPAQVKKAYREATFMQDEAVARLVSLGYSAADATIYLGE